MGEAKQAAAEYALLALASSEKSDDLLWADMEEKDVGEMSSTSLTTRRDGQRGGPRGFGAGPFSS